MLAHAFGNKSWNASKGEDRYRRSVYTFIKRTAPFAGFMTFDGTSGENCLAKRDRSNTPLQALTLLNDEMFLELARAAGSEVHLQKKDPVLTLFRRFLTRPPARRKPRLCSPIWISKSNAWKKGNSSQPKLPPTKRPIPSLPAKFYSPGPL